MTCTSGITSWAGNFKYHKGTGRAICRTLLFTLLTAFALPMQTAFAEKMVVPEDELPRLKKCEERLCNMVLKKEPAGEDLQCRLSKTWAQETIKGGEAKTVRWGFGDARCKLNFNLARSEIMSVLTKPEHTLTIPTQTVKCEVDRDGEMKPVVAKLGPKIIFKNGRAEKVWINLSELDGPSDIKSTIWTAAKLEDTLGIFHGSMIKSINKFLYKRCNDTYGPAAMAKALKKLNAGKRRAAAAARIEAAAKKATAEAGKDAAPAAKPAAAEAPAAAPDTKPAAAEPAPAPPAATPAPNP